MFDIIESILILSTGTKFIIPLTVSMFGSYIRTLQQPYSINMKQFFLRLILSIVGGIVIFIIIDNDLLLLLTATCIGYLSIDISDLFFKKK